MYPAPVEADTASFEDRYSFFFEEQQRNPYFHIHGSCPPDHLCQELASYDFGIQFMGEDFSPFDREYLSFYTAEKWVFSASNRLFDYLDAGLVVTMHPWGFMYTLFDSYGVALGATSELIEKGRPMFEQFRGERVRENIARARRMLSVDQNIDRLIAFYGSVGSGSNDKAIHIVSSVLSARTA
jgi:hypothetical protein